MASFLDIGLIDKLSIILPFLLVMVLVYALLAKTKVFGKNQFAYVIIAFVFGLVTILSPTIREVIDRMIPWFAWLFIFLFFILITFAVFGADENTFMNVLKSREYNYITTTIVIIAIIIGLGSLASVTFDSGGPTSNIADAKNSSIEVRTDSTGEQGSSAFWNTLFHPKVLGLVLVLLIAVFTMSRLSSMPL